MIYTITFNPAVDYVMHTDNLTMGTINHSSSEQIFFGGKGINVSLILKEFGIDSVTLGFIAGFTGEVIKNEMENKNIQTDFIRLSKGFSRINVKLKTGMETEINSNGPYIDEASLNQLFSKVEKLTENDIVVIAGSIPKCLSSNTYAKILEITSKNNVRSVIDATGDLLLNVLKYNPFLIKPNNFELEEMFNVKLNSLDDIEIYARKLQDMGAQNVLISMAEKGALLIDKDKISHYIGACEGKVVNSVGAGDSMLAGFLAGYIQTNDYGEALRFGTAAGGGTTFSEGLADINTINKLLKQIR